MPAKKKTTKKAVKPTKKKSVKKTAQKKTKKSVKKSIKKTSKPVGKKPAKKTTVKKLVKKPTIKNAAKPTMPATGDMAPDFSLPSNLEGMIDLSAYRGNRNVVLYFYPKDDTPGCTVEACSFRDNHSRILATGTVVIGVSPDSVLRHEKFATKYNLPFSLAADEHQEVARKYGVWVEKSMYGRTYMGIQRATFLINKEGRIVAVWPQVKVKGHTEEVLEAISNHC